ncbi:triphosphoribosyl-dephospho-CoA synthase [Methylomagnum ishizawai]|uniref:Triphosphoribosyl-dephospho-CoA synthase n=1 Tax=Methylomagnum ishizawai TaxID=1760988 RepID=A0A1Y6D2G8_9GAMM|nr:triphosphoribosyl-dephospho-CoA synthase [Methylomagnum ishizawai]SMF97138.1 triphosphoribosyl-dephospho-CoA synthase [Methylomagnum ishizawai]
MNTERQAALRTAYLEACEMELRAFKPGNVSVHSEGHGMTVEDFRRSAEASAPFLCDESLSLGERIYRAIEATHAAVGCNTNLGIVLLAAPLILAYETRRDGEALRTALDRVLAGTTRGDAAWVYRAIRVAQPGGLGAAPEQDVRAEPGVTLLEAMRLAEARDRIAFQYTNSYADILADSIPRYHSSLSQWGHEEWAAVAVFTGLLRRHPDSHIERKSGTRHHRRVAGWMDRIERALLDSDQPEQAMRLLREADAEFKSHGINPGTTADLTVACLLAVRLEILLMK